VETQLARLIRRPGMTPEISERIIASQMAIGLKIFRSHHVIWNEGALEILMEQTTLISRYLHDRYS
jgi:dephospho-CoA kinase